MSAILFPGSFDPVTKGHLDVIARLNKYFDRVVVLVADSPRKNYRFQMAERAHLIEEALLAMKLKSPQVVVKTSTELTVEFAKREKIMLIARSVRSVNDWEYEYAMAYANKALCPEIETIFIMADPMHGFISSSLVREVAAFKGDVSAFVSPNVERALNNKN
jgi:pantetheine-phosphate adenylyltransferase